MISLEEFFTEHQQAALAFSGGVDSAYLLYAASKYAASVRAYYVKTAFQPYFELDDALRLARELGVSMRVLCLDALGDGNVRSNPENRCYFCKRRIFEAIAERAKSDGFELIVDGTNASDDASDRPGMRALTELNVLSPLRLCGLTKADIRRLSREAGLFTWDKPSYSCLATRIPHGTELTIPLLDRTQRAESFMLRLGFGDFRVRTRGDTALIQVTEAQRAPLYEKLSLIENEFLKYYSEVAVDPEARHEQ